MKSRTLASPSSTILAGVLAAANSAGVALLTPASVACAESTTAISSVYGSTCSSSPFGSGRAARKRRNASVTSAGVHCGVAPDSASLSAATLVFGPLTEAALPARGLIFPGRLPGFLAGLAAAFLDAFLGVFRAMLPLYWPG